MKKYADSESKAKVLSPDSHKKAQAALHKQGKTSASELTDAEREAFLRGLRDSA